MQTEALDCGRPGRPAARRLRRDYVSPRASPLAISAAALLPRPVALPPGSTFSDSDAPVALREAHPPQPLSRGHAVPLRAVPHPLPAVLPVLLALRSYANTPIHVRASKRWTNRNKPPVKPASSTSVSGFAHLVCSMHNNLSNQNFCCNC